MSSYSIKSISDENKNFRILRYGSAAYMNQDTCQEKRIEDFNARNYLGVRSIPQDVMCLTNENTGFSGVVMILLTIELEKTIILSNEQLYHLFF